MNENIAQVGKKVLIDTGVQVLTNMMTSQEGRQNLAAILTALPDFFKKTVCQIDTTQAGPDSNIGMLSKACGLVASIAAAPLYGAAKVLPMLSDDEASVVVKAAKNIPATRKSDSQVQGAGVTPVGAEAEPDTEIDIEIEPEEEDLVGEVTRPLPVYEEEEDDEEDEENLKEVKAMIARNDARNERFRKLAGF